MPPIDWLNRLSTTSTAGSTKSVARITSTALTDGPPSASFNTKTSSISTSGRFNRLIGTWVPSSRNQSSKIVP